MKELNEELEENHVEAEKELQLEIDHRDIYIRDLQNALEMTKETADDYENTVAQFRSLVQMLQSDLSRLREEVSEKSGQDPTALSSQTQEMLNLNIQLQNAAVKSQAKSIELELRKLEASQALEHLELVQVHFRLLSTYLTACF